MTMQFLCDSCGAVSEVVQRGPESSASCVEPSDPPKGWRSIFTTVMEHDGEDGAEHSVGDVSHSCAACNARMSVDEQLDVDHVARRAAMKGGVDVAAAAAELDAMTQEPPHAT